MPEVLEFASEHMVWLHGQVGSLTLQGLHAGQFIHADRAFSSFGPLGRTCIDLTAIADLLVALRIRHLVLFFWGAGWLLNALFARLVILAGK